MTKQNDLIEHLRDEEHCAAANAIAARIEAIEDLPGPYGQTWTNPRTPDGSPATGPRGTPRTVV